MTSLSGLYIDETFPRLVQTDATRTQFADGLGNLITFGQTPTGSLLTTASIVDNSNIIRFTKGNGSTFEITVNTGSAMSLSGGTDTYIPLWSGSNALTSSYLNQSGSVLKTTTNGGDIGLNLNFSTNQFRIGDPNGISEDYGFIEVTPVTFTANTSEAVLNNSSIQIGRSDRVSQIEVYGNNVTVTGSSFTWNNRTVAVSVNSTLASTDGNIVITTVPTASYITASNVVGTVLSSSYALTASYALNGGGGGPVDKSGFVTTSSFNAFTSSVVTTSSFNNYTSSTDSQFAGTASFAKTASSADAFTVRGNLIVSGNMTFGDVITDSITMNASTMSLGSGTGILNIDSNTLYVDGVNNRVGIGKTSPLMSFDVNGGGSFTSPLRIGGGTYTTSGYNLQINSNSSTDTPIRTQGGYGVIQIEKDGSSTSAVAIGLSKPGVSIGDDYVLSLYNTTTGSWIERMRFTQAGNLLITGSMQLSGSSLKIDIPSKVNGYVLTTDAFGNATWQSAGAGASFPYTGNAVITGSLLVSEHLEVYSGSIVPYYTVTGIDLSAATYDITGSGIFEITTVGFSSPLSITFPDPSTHNGQTIFVVNTDNYNAPIDNRDGYAPYNRGTNTQLTVIGGGEMFNFVSIGGKWRGMAAGK